MKKAILAFLVVLLLIGLSGCLSSEDEEKEIQDLSERDYKKNAKVHNLELNDEDLSVILISSGFYATYSLREKEEKYRVDLAVENKGEGDRYFSVYSSVLLSENGQQYETSYGGTLSGGELKPGVSKKGYILFKDVPKDIKISKIQIGDDYIFDIKNSKAYTPSQFNEEEYEKNAVSLNINKKMDNYISITLDRIGLMKIGDETYIRADITVKNIGDEKISHYSPNPIILGKSSNQFEEAYISSYKYKNAFDSGDIFSNVVKKGALFFETKDNPELDLNELIIETGLSSYSKESRNIGDGQALLYDDEYVFKFDLSDINLK